MSVSLGLDSSSLLFTSGDESLSIATQAHVDGTVLLICQGGPDVNDLRTSLLAHGMRVLHAPDLARRPADPAVARHLFVDMALPGVRPYLAELTARTDFIFPVAIVKDDGIDGGAGLVDSIRRPLQLDQVLACIRRSQSRYEQQRQRQEQADRERQTITSLALDRVLLSLGYELRSPLATALANVEYLRDAEADGAVPLEYAERREMLTDTLDSLHRVRTTLEGLDGLLCARPGPRERLSLQHVVQHVIDDLPSRCQGIVLDSDTGLVAWGDEKTLLHILTALIRGAQGTDPSRPPNRVRLHTYAHENEARLSIRGEPQASVEEEGMPSAPSGGSPHGDTTNALVFAMLHHAVVLMGGTLARATPTHPGRHYYRLTLKRG